MGLVHSSDHKTETHYCLLNLLSAAVSLVPCNANIGFLDVHMPSLTMSWSSLHFCGAW